jgi:hypothetical protein
MTPISTLGQLPYEAIAGICRQLSFQQSTPLFLSCKSFIAFKSQIGDLFVGECMQEVALIKRQIVVVPLNIDQLMQTLTPQTIASFKEQTKIPLLRALLAANQASDDFLKHPFRYFAGIVSVFKCVYVTKEQVAKMGVSSLEGVVLTRISRYLINRERYAEAIEVVQSTSRDQNDTLLTLVKNLAHVRAITEAKSVAEKIVDPITKELALEDIEDAESSSYICRLKEDDFDQKLQIDE